MKIHVAHLARWNRAARYRPLRHLTYTWADFEQSWCRFGGQDWGNLSILFYRSSIVWAGVPKVDIEAKGPEVNVDNPGNERTLYITRIIVEVIELYATISTICETWKLLCSGLVSGQIIKRGKEKLWHISYPCSILHRIRIWFVVQPSSASAVGITP